MFQKNILPLCSKLKSKESRKPDNANLFCLFFVRLIDPEDLSAWNIWQYDPECLLNFLQWLPYVITLSRVFKIHDDDDDDKQLHSLSPQESYTDRLTASCWRSLCQLLRIEGVAWSAQWIPMAVFSVSRQELLIFLPSSSSVVLMRLSAPCSRPIRKSGSTGNQTQDIWTCSQELWPLDYRDIRWWS
jgi:hypothetical protein